MVFNAGAIIVCAGEGKRLGKIDKAVLKLEGKPLFYYSLRIFKDISRIRQIVLVLRKNHFGLAKKIIAAQNASLLLKGEGKRQEFAFEKDRRHILLVEGGRERKDSVFNGLLALRRDINYVLIHDGARPFVDKKIILNILKELKKHPAVICGVKPPDTLKFVDKDFVKRTIKRDNVFFAQTPQGFKKDLICKAYNKLKKSKFTDDSQILESIHKRVKVIPGSVLNFKITYPEDIVLAKAFIK